MSKNEFNFVHQYIHFGNNNSLKHHKGDPLYKIVAILKSRSSCVCLVWNASIYLTIYKSMIVYKERSIKFIQCLPMKPIKHGIKAIVFVMLILNISLLLKFTQE